MNPDQTAARQATPLQIALAASKPIDDSPRQPLPVELLLDGHKRRITIADHQAFRESLTPRQPVDPIDELIQELRNVRKENRP